MSKSISKMSIKSGSIADGGRRQSSQQEKAYLHMLYEEACKLNKPGSTEFTKK